ncbi:uncharacterized protein [Drosophila takahashii]|uniref:uncharacterized protein isoform X4 n=1 Tax=Drosophila takahashii TaxID=29030 RepID=UPI0038991FBF
MGLICPLVALLLKPTILLVPPRTSTTPEPVLHSQAIPSIGICCSSLTQTITPHYGFVYLSMEQEYN